MKYWAKQWAQLYSVERSSEIDEISFLHDEKKIAVTAHYLQRIKSFLTLKFESVSQEWQHIFLVGVCCCQRQLPSNWKLPVFGLASLTCQCCAGVLPQKLCHWFCNQNLRLPSGTAIGNDGQMISTGWNLDSILNSSAWPTQWQVVKGFISSKNHRQNCVEFKFFLGLFRMPKLKLSKA